MPGEINHFSIGKTLGNLQQCPGAATHGVFMLSSRNPVAGSKTHPGNCGETKRRGTQLDLFGNAGTDAEEGGMKASRPHRAAQGQSIHCAYPQGGIKPSQQWQQINSGWQGPLHPLLAQN